MVMVMNVKVVTIVAVAALLLVLIVLYFSRTTPCDNDNDNDNVIVDNVVSTDNSNSIKILALHGGGSNAGNMIQATEALRGRLPNDTRWVYIDAIGITPSQGSRWFIDPPGGKNNPTTDPAVGDPMINKVNEIIRTMGPFDGIIGFSQGAAAVNYFMSDPNRADNFRFAVSLCGYLPTTHNGIMSNINSGSRELRTVPILMYAGTNDSVINLTLTQQARSEFRNVTWVQDNGGHAIPNDGETLNRIVSWIETFIS